MRVASSLAAWSGGALIALAGCTSSNGPDAGAGQAGATSSDAAIDAGPSTIMSPFTPVDPATYDGPRVAPGVDLSAPHEIVRRECEVRRYGSSWTIEPGLWCNDRMCSPGIECTRPQDCPRSPHARCLGSGGPEGHCDYGAGPTAETGCITDEECRASPGGRCVGVIWQTACQYNNQCTVHADCSDGRRCECGSSGDLLCVEVDCLSDADCPDAERCLRSNPCGYGPYGDYRCTTPRDECEPYGSDACICDFEDVERRWVCKSIICD